MKFLKHLRLKGKILEIIEGRYKLDLNTLKEIKKIADKETLFKIYSKKDFANFIENYPSKNIHMKSSGDFYKDFPEVRVKEINDYMCLTIN
jgi:hypothetical protein